MIDKETQSDDIRPEDALRNLSAQDFLSFGVSNLAYIRSAPGDGGVAYALYAADGRHLSTLNSHRSARLTAQHNDLETVTLH